MPRKKKGKQSKEDKRKRLAELDALIVQHEEKVEEVKEADPFWFYEPSDGIIGEREKEFLRKYLNEDDIPKRIDGQRNVHLSVVNIRGASGGNQSGKSTVGAVEAYIQATGELPKSLEGIYPREKLPKKWPQAIRVVGVDYKTLLNTLIPTYQKWVPRQFLKDGKWANSFSSEQKKLFLYKDGKCVSTIEFMTNQQDVESFQGPPLDMVIYDEEPRQEIYKENLLRFTTADRLNVLFCWTPTKGLSWTYDLFMEETVETRGKPVELYKLCSVANKKANLESLDEIIGRLDDYQEIKMRLLGEFISLSGLVYGRLFDYKTHVIEPFYENLNKAEKRKDYVCLMGADPHGVTPSAMVFVLLDRENNMYVDRCYARDCDTDELKADYWDIIRDNGYRPGWAVADKSSDSSIIAFGGRNIYRELKMGKNAIPALRTSVKFEGSIKAGVDEIKKRLKNKTFFIVDRPENRDLIKSFRTLERDTYANEEKQGPKDRIVEGKHHYHACLRYINQFPVNWYPEMTSVPQPRLHDAAACY